MSEVSCRINAWNEERLLNRIAKLAKQAKKIGVVAPEVAFSDYHERVNPETGNNEVWCLATLQFEDIKIAGGWRLVASIEKGELGNMVYAINGKDYSHLRTQTLTCDHCQTKRKRNKHFILVNDEGEEKCVGSTCMKDFLGVDPAKTLNFFTTIRELFKDDELFSCGAGKGDNWLDLTRAVAWSCREIEVNGFVSRQQEYNNPEKTSTANSVRHNIYLQNMPRVSEKQKELVRPSEKNLQHAEEVVSKFNEVMAKVEQNPTSASEFDWKIANIAKRGFILPHSKEWNIMVGSVNFHLKAIIKETEEQAAPIGLECVDTLLNANTGERVEFEGTVLRVNEVVNQFAYYNQTSFMVIIKLGDKEKNVKVRWFSSKDMGINEGEVHKFSAKVKRIDHHPTFGTTVQANYPKII